MSTPSRELRFGVEGRDEFFSRYWKIRAAASEPEFYVTCQRIGGFFHVSFHRGASHVKVLWQRRDHVRSFDPVELAPGFLRLMQVRVPPGAVDQPLSTASVVWVAQPSEPDRWTLFDLVWEAPGAAMVSWPGKRSMETELVGRVRLSDGSTVVVVTWTIAGTSGSVTLRAGDELEEVQRLVRSERLRGLVHGLLEDGTPWFMESRIASVTEGTDSA